MIPFNKAIKAYRLISGPQKNQVNINQHIYLCLTRTLSLIEIDSYLAYLYYTARIVKILEASPEWLIEAEKIKTIIKHSYSMHFNQHRKPNREGMEIMEIKDLIEQELLSLKPIEVNNLNETEYSASQLILEIKETVTKGNRMSFKLIQELSQKLDELSEGDEKSKRDFIKEELVLAEQREKELIKLLLDMYELLELVSTTIQQNGNVEWVTEVENVINKALAMLGDFGIKEIDVQNKLYDGETMEGVDTIAQSEVSLHYEKYQVYSIIRRGFINISTGEILRKARVKTVL